MPWTDDEPKTINLNHIVISDHDGYRWTTKKFTRPRGTPVYAMTPEGIEIYNHIERYKALGHLESHVEIRSLPEDREQFVLKNTWKNKDSYNEFEAWYMAPDPETGLSMQDKTKEYEKKHNIIHEYNVEALNSSSTVDEHLQKSFIEKMAFRRNIQFFDQKKNPEKTVIEKILKDSFHYVPILQCVYPFRVKIWGPEYHEMKKQLVIRSVCGPNQENFRRGGKHQGDWKLAEEIYDKWINQWIDTGEEQYYDGYYFNQQIMAPYLISWHPMPDLPTQTQLDKGYVESRTSGHMEKVGCRQHIQQMTIGVSMHGYGMSLLAANYGLHASFTRNIIVDFDTPETLPEMVKPMFTSPDSDYHRIPFVMGIGYRDPRFTYFGDSNMGKKPTFDEINLWQ